MANILGEKLDKYRDSSAWHANKISRYFNERCSTKCRGSWSGSARKILS